MTTASSVQTKFTGGEWSKSAQGRMDDPRYRSAMNLCQNTLPLVEGSTTRRFGLRLAAPTRGGAIGRILPYVFHDEFGLRSDAVGNLELIDGAARFYQDGVLLTEIDMAVTNITLSTYVTVTCTAHGYATDDIVRFRFDTAAAMLKFALLTNRQFIITVVDANTFTLSDVVTGHVLTDSFTAFAAATDTVKVAKVVEFDTPYTDGDWAAARILQSDDRTLLLHGSIAPQALTEDEIDPAAFVDGPYLDPVDGSWITPDALSGVVNFVLSFQTYDSAKAYSEGDYVTYSSAAWRSLVDENQNHTPAEGAYWTAATASDVVNGGSGFNVLDVGRHVRFLSEPPLWATATSYTAGNIVSFGGTYWVALASMTGATPAAGDANPNQPGIKDTTWAPTTDVARWTWGKVVASASVPGLIDASSGTRIGNMNGGAGLAAAFDGNTAQALGSGASGPTGATGYIGKNFASSPKAVGSVKIYPSTTAGFTSLDKHDELNTAGTVTIKLYGKSGSAPSNGTDGTLLGTTGAFVNTFQSKTIASTDSTTTWDYVWVYIVGQLDYALTSEVQFYSATTAAGAGVAVQIIGDPLLYIATVRTWRLGVYNDFEPRWPTNGCYHEGRFWLAGAVVNRFDASMSNKELTFSPTAADGSVTDSHAISYTLSFKEKNDILWMKPETTGILAGTAEAAVLIRAPTPGAMAPTNITANPVTSYGCAEVEPAVAGLTIVFVHKYSRRVHEQLRDAYSGAIVSPEISDTAKHMTVGGIEEITLTKALQPIVWMRTGDGMLIATTYRRTNLIASEPPDVNAWQRHPIGGDMGVVSIARAPSFTDSLDTLGAVLVGDNGVHHVCFGTRMPEEDDTIWQSEYLDDAIIPSCGEHYTSETGIRFHGLWNLNGQTITAWVAGLDCGDFVVQSGYVEVPYGSAGGLFTKRYVTQLSASGEDFLDLGVVVDTGEYTIPALFGRNYVSRGQLLRPASSADTGAQTGPGFGKSRRLHQVAALVHNTQGLYLGTDFAKMRPALFERPGGRKYTATELFSGIHTDTLDDDNSLDGMLAWETRRPYPTRVLAIGPKLQTQD